MVASLKKITSSADDSKNDEESSADEKEAKVRIDRKGRLYVDIDELAASPSFRRQIEVAAKIQLPWRYQTLSKATVVTVQRKTYS